MAESEREMIDRLWVELLEEVPFLPLDIAVRKMVEHHDFWENGQNIDRTSEAIMDAVVARYSLERRN